MANITVLNRLKMELSNKDYFSDEIYIQFLTENDLNPDAEYVKASMQEHLLYTCLDILEAVSNDMDIMRKIETEFITQEAAYTYLADRIQRIKNRIASLPSTQEDYSPFSLIYANGVAEMETPSTPEDIDIQFQINDGYLCVSVNGGAWQILMDMSELGVDLSNYYTKAEVDAALANVSVDLSAYSTTEEVASAISTAIAPFIAGKEVDRRIAAALATIEVPSLEGYATEAYVDGKIPSLDGYATEEYVTTAIANAQLGGGDGSTVDLSTYATKEYTEATYAKKEDIPSVDGFAAADHTHDEYLTEHQDLSAYALKEEIPSLDGYAKTTDIPDTSNFATKEEIPTVPENVSAFTNDAGYLTEHQSLAGYLRYEVVTAAPETQEEGVLYIVTQ